MNSLDSNSVPPGLLEARRIAYEIAKRSNWKKRKRTLAQQRYHDQESRDWRARVDAAKEEALSPSVGITELRSIYTLLSFFLLTAPTEEEANDLYDFIGVLKDAISRDNEPARLRLVHSI